MKILLLGAENHIGNYLKDNLKGHQVFAPDMEEKLKLYSSKSTLQYFKRYTKKKKFDLVIYCTHYVSPKYNPASLNKNIASIFNLLQFSQYYKNIISIGTGEEFDKELPIHDKVNDLNNSYPLELYGMTKNLIARLINSKDNCYHIRLFGLISKETGEENFIKKTISNCIQLNPIKIQQDRYFDFFNLKDILKVINFYINSLENSLPLKKDIDLVYPDKLKLSDIANFINNFSEKKVEIKIKKSGLGNSYTGSKVGIPYDIELDGLKKGIRQIYNSLLKEKELEDEI